MNNDVVVADGLRALVESLNRMAREAIDSGLLVEFDVRMPTTWEIGQRPSPELRVAVCRVL